MKLLENVIYSSILFLFVYLVISMTLRLFSITEVFTAHLVGGIAATVIAVLAFMYMLIYKGKGK